MKNIAILIDGHFSRILIKDILNCNPTPELLKKLCNSFSVPEETIFQTHYYDCEPFGEKKELPISGRITDFSLEVVYKMARKFQQRLIPDNFFVFHQGKLDFKGWKVRDEVLEELKLRNRILSDRDFVPNLSQKQVDIMIGRDIIKLANNKAVDRIFLVSGDSDFIPVLEEAKIAGKDVCVITGGKKTVKKELLRVGTIKREIDSTRF
jgi:uncharacterized LabA/DUF88 family protein